MRWIRNAWSWFTSLFRRKPRPWATQTTDEIPEKPLAETVYLVGEGEYLWFVAFVCPCGCRELIQLNLLPDTCPRWGIVRNPDGTVTLAPSVWRTTGCRSHFFLRQGRIDWC
jgi:hypothetical protein